MTEVVTFGCRLNTYESEAMRKLAEEAGLADAVIVNTCAVTAEAARQAGQAIRRVHREKPNAKIIVTGCAAQIDSARYAAMPEVDFVVGNGEKLKVETYRDIAQGQKKNFVTPLENLRETHTPLVRGFEGLARAFVQVQNGCDHRCTFCVIPFGRGPSRSVPMAEVIEQVRLLVAEGYNEIVFTGVDITAYGQDFADPSTLGCLVSAVLKAVPDLPRLRLSSVDPVEVDEDLFALIETEQRLMPHFHISLQSGDDLILKRMKRRHNCADVIAFCDRVRKIRPDAIFGADIIVGFPTETEDMFQNTMDIAERCDLTWLHIFTYSARTGTPAARMPQVHGSLRKERAARLRDLGDKAAHRHLESLVGKRLMALVEQTGVGCAPSFAKMIIPSAAKVGAVVEVEGVKVEGDKLVAKLVKETV